MDLLSLCLAIPLMLGVHEVGHNQQAQDLYVDIRWNPNNASLLPYWQANARNSKELALIGGAGFRNQDIFSDALEGSVFGKSFRVVSAINKIGYVFFPNGASVNEPNSTKGDISAMNKAIGDSALPLALLGSSIVDLYKVNHPNPAWTIYFSQSYDGIPGLTYSRRF